MRFLTNLQLAKPDRFLKKSPDRFQYQNALIIDTTGKAYLHNKVVFKVKQAGAELCQAQESFS